MHSQNEILTPRQMERLKSRKSGEFFFDYVPFAMMASDAWLGATPAVQAVVWRLYVEHGIQKRENNGRLRVTYRDFVRWGIPKNKIVGGIELAKQLGFVTVIRGAAGCGKDSRTSEYGLTFLPWHDGTPPFHTWATADSAAKGRASRTAMEAKRGRLTTHMNAPPPKPNGHGRGMGLPQ
jgi:hypothetical protein